MNIATSTSLLVRLCSIVIPLSACGGSGGGADPSATYTVSGTVSGLTRAGVTLSDGTDTIAIAAGATSFTLPVTFHAGETYAVTISAQEPSRDETCTLDAATGTVHAADVSDLALVCAPTHWVATPIAGVAISPDDDSCELRDGPGAQATFCLPQDLVAARDGTIYVGGPDVIRVIANDDQHHVTTLVAEPDLDPPPPGRIGPTYRTPSMEIDGITFDDATGTLYFSDSESDQIFTVTPGVGVASLAGGHSGTADGQGASARFNQPWGLALGTDGNLRVADLFGMTVREVTPGGAVTTIAGTPGSGGFVDGPGPTAKFQLPLAVAQDAGGNLYVVDYNNEAIREIAPDGTVSTLAGGTAGRADGVGKAASFAEPNSIAVDPMGNVFVADFTNRALRKISAGGVVTTILQYDAPDGIANVSARPDGSLIAITEQRQIVRIAPQ